MTTWTARALIALLVVLGRDASATAAPGLDQLMTAARARDLGVAIAEAEAGERDAELGLARAGLYPALTLAGGYTRNQNEAIATIPGAGGAPARSLTIVPFDQLEAAATVNLPLLDLRARRQVTAAAAARDAARLGRDAVVRDTERAVVRAYYGWIGGTSLMAAADVAERAAVDNLAVVEQRAAADLATNLDVTRARAAVADARQSRAAAALVTATAQRQLATLTGLDVGDQAPALPTSTEDEGELKGWLVEIERQPDVQAAAAIERAARTRVEVARAGWWPTIALTASERWTNAAGFGEALTGAVGLSASWRLELGTSRRIAVERAAVTTASVRAARAGQVARDRVIDAWNAVTAERAAVEAARAREAAAREGAAVAASQFAARTGTQLEVALAQREAFAAAVALVQAQAELAAARALLRLAAGRQVTP